MRARLGPEGGGVGEGHGTPTSRGAAPVTVLMACRDVEPSFFREALDSVLGQSTPSWRLCVVVDADDPATAAAVRAAVDRQRDPRIAVLVNAGRWITGALNTGLRHATTPYVCVLHADDLLDEAALATLARYIDAHPDVDYFHSSRIYVDDTGRPLGEPRRAVESFTLDDFKDRGPVKGVHCFKVQSALAIGGMDETLGPHGADDYDFSWSMAEAGYGFKAIPECLYYYRDHRRHYRLTTHVPLDVQVAELVKILRKHRIDEREIAELIRTRVAGYLKQALYVDDEDRRRKEQAGYDIRQGWRQRYDDRAQMERASR